MRVLVCGSRTWTDLPMVDAVLVGLRIEYGLDVLIHGGAKGADTFAERWALATGIEVRGFLAEWERYGRRAGPIRNERMLSLGKPDLVVAFTEQPPTPGTADMIRRAKAAGLPVWVVSHG